MSGKDRSGREYALACAEIVGGRIDRFVARKVDASGKERRGFCIAGSYRRRLPSVGDVDLVVVPKNWLDIEEIHWEFAEACVDKELLSSGSAEAHGMVRFDNDSPEIQVDMWFTPWDQWGAALMCWTGSDEYNRNYRGLGKKRGLSVSHLGVKRDGQLIPGSGVSEASVCKTIGIPWLHPWERVSSCFPKQSEPIPTWCIDHMTKDFCKRERNRRQDDA